MVLFIGLKIVSSSVRKSVLDKVLFIGLKTISSSVIKSVLDKILHTF